MTKMERSRSRRRVKVKTPSGEVKIHYRERKPAKVKCGVCGDVLKGVPNKRPRDLSKLSKSKKRPERPYGGVLCSKCTRKKLLEGLKK